MLSGDGLRVGLSAAIEGVEPGLATADRLCQACVELLEVDGAAITLLDAGSTRGTFGSSGELSRRLDEFQFTFGEGPCLDAALEGVPVLVADLQDAAQSRWPAYAGAVLGAGVRAVYALPVSVSSVYVGTLDLFRLAPGELSAPALAGGLLAADLAALPLLDLMSATVDWGGLEAGDPWDQLAGLERVEVYQATGMITVQLDVDATEALVRLRAHAFAHAMTASDVAWAVVNRRLRLRPDGSWHDPSTESTTPEPTTEQG